MTPATFGREAAEELAEAAAWYDGERPGLGSAFLDQVQAKLVVIAERPLSFPRLSRPREPTLRRALVPRFPFRLVFLEIDDALRVVAVARDRRAPDYRLQRVE